jgi:hypothetical protein
MRFLGGQRAMRNRASDKEKFNATRAKRLQRGYLQHQIVAAVLEMLLRRANRYQDVSSGSVVADFAAVNRPPVHRRC